ncbi:MAG: T9SS type A sorting domain-containing protein [Bacteroidota bacterium]|jgi:Chaperone of endosialidase/Secretion system C-terminal sorting domain
MGQSIGSDSSFKTNICEIESPLEKVLKLRGILYNAVKPVKGSDSLRILDKKGVWHTVATGQAPYLDSTQFKTGVLHRLLEEQKMKHLGVIAQEMEKVVPEAVRMMPDGKLSVEYYGLIGLLIEAIKEQQRLIESCLANSEKPLNSKADLEENGSILFQNIPNPFSKNTIIQYRISSEAKTASILIFDMQGLLLKTYDGLTQKGEIQINGYDLKPGMYLYSLIVDGSEAGTKRMILTR